MDDLAALDVASQEFGRRLAEIRDDQWPKPTPCGDWTVDDLVRHINVGNRMSELLLGGADATDLNRSGRPATRGRGSCRDVHAGRAPLSALRSTGRAQ